MSAIPEEGKSMLTKGLALGFQGSGRNVLVVDANLRDPVLDEWFGAQRAPGLTDILRSETTPELAVQEASIGDDSAGEVHFDERNEPEPESVLTSAQPGSEVHKAPRVRGSTKIRAKYLRALEEEEDWDVLPGPALQPVDSPPGLSGSVDGDTSSTSAWGGGTAQSGNGNRRVEPVLHLISSGGRVPDPGGLLGTAQLARFLSQAKVAYDVVLVDSSPLLAVSDAIPLAAAVDGVIVVSRSNLTTRDDAQRLRRALDRLPGVTVLGLVLNGDRDSHARYHYYDAGYT
jgi:Mrp family chromosome partitioning ATPase